MSPSVDQEKHAHQVIELHAAGVGRNEIARRLGVSTYRVDQAAAEHDLTFDAAHTSRAAEVVAANARADRIHLAARFRAFAARALDNAEHHDDPQVVWMWVKSAATAVDKDMALAARTSSDGTAGEPVQLLRQFFGALGREDGGGSHD